MMRLPVHRSPSAMENHISCFKATPEKPNNDNCLQCRWRKVRCDRRRGSPGGCGSCQRLRLSCSFVKASQSSRNHDSSARPNRLRGPRACVACRERKVRCSASLPSCTHCQRRGQPCVYPAPQRALHGSSDDPFFNQIEGDGSPSGGPFEEPPTPTTSFSERRPSTNASAHTQTPPTGDASVTSPSPPVTDSMLALVDAFFEKLYPLPSYAFLHPHITKRRCRNGKMHRALAAAICAVTSHHLASHEQSAASAEWIQAAEQSVWMHLESPTIPRLQTLLLVIYHYVETGRFQRAFMLTATAARFASAMRLNYERSDLDSTAREVRRRILWSLKIVERYFSVGLQEFELFPIEAIYIDYPSKEEAFSGDSPEEQGALSTHAKLEVIRRDVMKLTRSLSSLDQRLPSITELIQHHANSLEDVGSLMPDRTLSTSEIKALINTPWLSRRIPMHISWHQTHCDLYRILLPGYPEAAPQIVLDAVDQDRLADAEKQCFHHAMAVMQILVTLNQESLTCPVLEYDTAICAYHATRLLLFLSRHGRLPECRITPEYAASRADLCLAALRRFFLDSLLVSPIIEELQHHISVFSQKSKRKSPLESSAPRSRADQRGTQKTKESPANMTQDLAVHSLLRQAEFGDEDEDQAEPADLASAEELSQSLGSAGARTVPTTHGTPAQPGDVRECQGAALALDVGTQPAAGLCSPDIPSAGASWGPDLAHGGGFGETNLNLFAWGGPQDWDWMFDHGEMETTPTFRG